MDGIEGAAMLPVGIRNDIDEAFCFREDMSYQERAHGYLERCEVKRGYRDTAVQAVVTDLACRAFAAGREGAGPGEAPAATGPSPRSARVEQVAGDGPSEWLVDLDSVSRMEVATGLVVLADGGDMSLSLDSAEELARMLEARP